MPADRRPRARNGAPLLLLTLTLLPLASATAGAETPAHAGTAAGEDEAAEPVLGAPAAFDLSRQAEPPVRLEAGTVLRQTTARRAPQLRRLDVAAELPARDRRGPWVKVRFDGVDGWALLEEAGAETLESALPDALPEGLRPRGVEPGWLAATVARLGAKRSAETFGGFAFHSDVGDDALRARLRRIGDGLGDAFARRYGIAPPPPDGEAVVLFAAEAPYRELAGVDPAIADLGSLGHAGGGLAVLFRGDRPAAHVETSLVHELTHLTTRRALGLELPIWLEEGLAEDLAYSRIDDDGSLLLGTVRSVAPLRRREAIPGGVRIDERRAGGRAALEDLQVGWSPAAGPALERVLGMSREAFLHGDRALHYALAGFFVRFLLDAGDPALAAGFRAYLGTTARGDEAGVERLREHLGRDWRALERAFAVWLQRGAGRGETLG